MNIGPIVKNLYSPTTQLPQSKTAQLLTLAHHNEGSPKWPLPPGPVAKPFMPITSEQQWIMNRIWCHIKPRWTSSYLHPITWFCNYILSTSQEEETWKKKNHRVHGIISAHFCFEVAVLPCYRASIRMPGEFQAISAPEVRFRWNGFLRREPALRGRSAH